MPCKDPEKRKEYERQYRLKNKEKLKAKDKEYRLKNPEKEKARKAKHQLENPESVKLYRKRYYEANKEKLKIASKERYKQNRESHKAYVTEYVKRNKEVVNARVRKRDKYRRVNDPNYKIAKNLRSGLWKALKGISKSDSTINLLGCSIEELKAHLESQFTEGMSWDNYGEFHIDHIKPCASFDLTDPEEQKKCFHYSNLQPLWAIDNLSKGDKYEDE